MVNYGIKVFEIMNHKPVTISPNSSISGAAKLMSEKDVGSLLVVKDKMLVGIITERDITSKVVASRKNSQVTKVSSIMSKNVITVSPNDDLYKVHFLMNKHNFRRLPVVEDGKLVGMLTEKDLIKIEPSIIDVLSEKLKISEPKFKLRYTVIK